MARKCPALMNRNGNYYFRYVIASGIQQRFECKEFTYSLGTKDYHAAKAKIGILLALAESIMTTVKQGKLTPEQAREFAQQYFRQCLERLELQLDATEERSIEIAHRANSKPKEPVMGKHGLPEYDWDADDFPSVKEPNFPLAQALDFLHPPLLDSTLEGDTVYFGGEFMEVGKKPLPPSLQLVQGIDAKDDGSTTQVNRDQIHEYCRRKFGLQHIQPDTYSYNVFTSAIDRAIVELINIHQQKLGHEAHIKIKDAWFRDGQEQQGIVHTARSEAKSLPLISDLFKKYLVEKRPAHGTVIRKQQAIDLWLIIIGEGSIETLSKENVVKYKEAIAAIPKNFTQRYKGKTLKDIDLNAVPEQDRRDKQTVNNHIADMKAFVNWCEKNSSYEGKNYFSGISFPKAKGKNASKGRLPFTEDELKTIFSSQVYTGDSIVWDDMYWVPLIAAYSGARLQEICQLYVTDIKQTEYGWIFDINEDGDDKLLKTPDSARQIPIHSVLIQLGLLNYLKQITKRGHRLFPDIPLGNKKTYSEIFSKRFAYHRIKTLKIVEKGKCFHSFRHTCIDALRNAGVPDNVAEPITGHKEGKKTIHDGYGLGINLKLRFEGMEKVKYPINITPKQKA